MNTRCHNFRFRFGIQIAIAHSFSGPAGMRLFTELNKLGLKMSKNFNSVLSYGYKRQPNTGRIQDCVLPG